MKVIDNFINSDDCNNIFFQLVHSNYFPWFYIPKTIPSDDHSLFQHNFFIENIKSEKYDIILPLINKLNSIIKYKDIARIKANLYVNKNKKEKHKKHTDINDYDNFITAIYYLNTTNGYTTIGKKKIKDKKNRLVFFNGLTPHFGTTQTDTKERVLINFNFLL